MIKKMNGKYNYKRLDKIAVVQGSSEIDRMLTYQRKLDISQKSSSPTPRALGLELLLFGNYDQLPWKFLN